MKKLLMPLLVIIVLVWSFSIYTFIYQQDLIKSLFYSLSIFFGNLKEADDLGKDVGKLAIWQGLYIPSILGLIIVVWAIITLYLKLFGKSLKSFWKINFCESILVVGLGEGNKAYIDSEIENENNIIAIEKNTTNKYLTELKDIVTLIGDARSVIKKIKFKNIKHIVISVGNDLENIAIAKEILLLQNNIDIFLQINSRELKNINLLDSVLKNDNIHIFSYYSSSARELFIDGNIVCYDTVKSNQEFSIVIIGDTEYVVEIVYETIIMGQLPNENKLSIYIIGNNINEIKNAILINFDIENIENLIIDYIKVDINQKEFYELDLWENKNLEHIIFCFNDNRQSIKALTVLNQERYIKPMLNGENLKVKINVSVSNSSALSLSLHSDDNKFRLVNIFGDTKIVNNKDNIIAKQRDLLAIAVNFVYSNVGIVLLNYDNYRYKYYLYNDNTEIKTNEYLDINDSNWRKISHFHKESNRAVAEHLLVKLRYLGLKLVKSNINNKEKLFHKNAKIFFNTIDNNSRIKLAISEHNRWISLHYLHKFKKVDFVSKEEKKKNKKIDEAKKEHMCLIPFGEFKERSAELLKLGYEKGSFEGYDIMIIEFIPNIVTYAGFEIVKRSLN